ncbi:MAG: leucine-rich repeat protein [Paludibacteraceae bacterium]|nr:leucine-rich repeat protein [Paludibacteraceae bacterium]
MRTFTTIAIAAALSLSSASSFAEVTHLYDESTKTLTFSGEGEMNVYTTDIFGDTYIDPEWSNLKEEVENVIINEGVTNVGKHAFMGFTELKEVKLASTIETIGEAAFEECKSLASIQLPEGLKTIEEEAFYECKSLTSISIPKNVTELPDYAFQSCSNLKSIDLGNVETFGKHVFAYCGFESFEIPTKAKVLSEAMFLSCRSLKKISIPSWVEKIENEAFHYSGVDTMIFLGETFPEVEGQNTFLGMGTTVFIINCKAYNEESVQAIRSNNYYNSKIIPSWPNGSEISSNDNSNGPLTITPIDCEKNLYKLSVELWSSSYKLTWEGSYDIPEADLHKTEIIVDLTKPATITANIKYEYGGGTTTNIYLLNDAIGMGDIDVTQVAETETSQTYKVVAVPKEGYEFLYWDTYPEDLLTEEQKKSTEVEFTITKTSRIHAYFSQSPYCGKDGGENISWSIKNDTLYLIGEGEMEDYTYMDYPPYTTTQDEFHYVSVSEGITTIGSMAFYVTEDIKEIYLPSTMAEIGRLAFKYSEDLEKIHFAGNTPPTFTNLNGIFQKDESTDRAKLVVPCDALEAYKEYFSTYQESNDETGIDEPVELQVVCEADGPQEPRTPTIDDFTFDPTNICGAEGDGTNVLWAFDEKTGTLALKGTGLMKDYKSRSTTPWRSLEVKNLIVSEGVTNIGSHAFMSKSTLENIYLPTTIERIEDYAFAEIDSVKELTLPEGVKYIDNRAFQSLTATKVVLPNTLEEIGEGAFQYCHFSRIDIPKSVTKIGKGAFYYVYELEEIVFESETPANTDGNTFVSKASITSGTLPKIVVPCDAASTYKETPGYQPEYVQGVYPYKLTVKEKSGDVTINNQGGKAYIKQWPDCETGEAIAYVYTKNEYKFSHWEAEGITLTEEQAKSDTITLTVDADCTISAVFVEKESVGVDDIDADDIVVTSFEGNISVNRNEFRIYDALGRNVTNANGHLTSGIYLVKCEEKSFKTVLK